jgi:pyruvate dehydrogenase E2 component (dihydrolipoamide acetyltransferase)
MATEVLMPKQGNSVESCIILDWKKKEGDSISIGEIICEAETDKSTIEVESTAEGTILKLLYAVGDEVPVQSPMMIVGEPGEKVEFSASSAVAEVESGAQAPAPSPAPAAEKTQVVEKAIEKATEKATEVSAQGVSPRARSLASSTGIAVNELGGTGPKGRVIERDVVSALASREPLSPAALEAMVAQGLQAPSKGSGMGGRILLADLVKDESKGDAPVQAASTAVQNPAAIADFPGAFTETVVKGVRKVTAKRMHESIATTAQFTLNSYANASAMKRLRERFKNSDPRLGLQKITINDLILFAVSRTILQFPYVNSHFLGDRMLTFEHVHLGCAVDTPKGLLVPVIKYADTMSLSQISATFKGLSSAALEGKASPDDLSGSTFTVTNLGSMGVETFTPVLNVPEVAILGVGGISLRPVEDEDEDIAFIPHIGLSLTIDHQGVDGAPGARFLKALCENIASIDLLLAL